MLEIGIRVVRGPDWKWSSQDNGEGHVGTVVEVGRPGSSSSPDKTVVVQWDMGSRTNYRVGYQEAYDLRLFDNAPAGVRHPNVICDGCKDHGISGMLWKCTKCFDFDLCTMCYMNDTHDLHHPFRRFDTASSVGVDLPPRHDSPKVVSKGIFAGARVVRGPDWDWSLQDGGTDGEPKVGRVVDIRGWDHESGRSVANVIWSSGSTNVYRLGHKGKVDLKCVQASSAGSYYVNHLPVLGMPTSTINKNSTSGLSKPISSKHSFSFNVGDKVQVAQDIVKLKDMQEGHGGWNERMSEFVGKVGVVHRVTDKGDIRVQYESGIRWTFNPAAVTKITSFSVADIVQVYNDYAKVKELQKGHGEWVDVMKDILGKTGTIVKIYADNDLRINFGSSVWTMNPLTVKLVPSEGFEANSMYANANRREETTNQDPMSSMLPLLDDMSMDTTINIERFVREAAQGRVETVKKMIPKIKDRLNNKSSGKTALQVAAHQGHMEIVVLLVAAGANLEIADDDGDTSVHYSAFGNQPMVMDLLLKAGALVNAVNKGQCTPLHVAVNKQYLECVKVLLKYKCNVNIQDSYGDSPIFDAISKDHRDIIHCFMNTPGIDFTLRNNRGFNVLHHAALKGNHYAVGKLVSKARQLVDVKKDDGFAALHLAALNGHYLVAKSLIEEGQAEIDIRNNRRQTALTLAMSQGYCGLVELLISKGCLISPDDEEGDTPLHSLLMKHFDSQGQQQNNHPHLPNPVTGSELRKHENAPLVAEIFANLVTCGWSPNEDETGAAALACFVAQAGADINKRNRRGVTPFDLIRSDRLKEMLAYYSAQSRLRSVRLSDSEVNEEDSAPPISSVRKSGVGQSYAGACAIADVGISVKSMPSSSALPLDAECLLCSEVTELITFEPCMHRVVCQECCLRMKKCVNCQQIIHRKLNRHGQTISASGRTSSSSSSGGNSGINTSAERLRYLENKFAEIEEAYCCSICMERRKNIAFLCGHGACERCADALSVCHFCRTPITQKINLY